MSYAIYVLTDSRDGRPYYIGVSQDWQRRHAEHCEHPRRTRVSKRNQAIIAAGLLPQISVVEVVESKIEALIAEVFWIETYLMRGSVLLNRENRSWLVQRLEKEHTRVRRAKTAQVNRKRAAIP